MVSRLIPEKFNTSSKDWFFYLVVVVVVLITLSFSWDGSTLRTAIQIHAVNLIEMRLGEIW